MAACVIYLLLGHPLQHLVAARLGRLGRVERVVLAGRLRQAGEQRGLGEREVLRRLVEEHPRRGLHADGGLAAVGAVGHDVQVLGRASRACPARPCGCSRARSASFASRILRLQRLLAWTPDVEVADELHRQRRAALRPSRRPRRSSPRRGGCPRSRCRRARRSAGPRSRPSRRASPAGSPSRRPACAGCRTRCAELRAVRRVDDAALALRQGLEVGDRRRVGRRSSRRSPRPRCPQRDPPSRGRRG